MAVVNAPMILLHFSRDVALCAGRRHVTRGQEFPFFSGSRVSRVVSAALRVLHWHLQQCAVGLGLVVGEHHTQGRMWTTADVDHLACAPPVFASCLRTPPPGFHYTINLNSNTQVWAKGEFRRRRVGSRSENAKMFGDDEFSSRCGPLLITASTTGVVLLIFQRLGGGHFFVSGCDVGLSRDEMNAR